jgi:glycosyltransferase involved in cell wall biosynthesis
VSNKVMMSVYGADTPSFLLEAIESTLQTSVDTVLIGIDGPIGDELGQVLIACSKRDPRVQVIRYPTNRGLACVLNDLIDRALADPSCEFVSRMDADDICTPGRFVRQIAFMRQHPTIDVLGCWASVIDDNGRTVSEYRKPSSDSLLRKRLSIDSPFVHPTVVFRARVLRQGHRYPTDTVRFEDVALWARLATSGCVFGNLPEQLLQYRYSLRTAGRRLGFRKVACEVRVRAGYLMRTMPWRIDLFAVVLSVALAKVALPPSSLGWLQSLRSKLARVSGSKA